MQNLNFVEKIKGVTNIMSHLLDCRVKKIESEKFFLKLKE